MSRETGSWGWNDIRCPECGELMTNHVILTRHATGACEESFTGPPLPDDLEGAVIETERSSAIDLFMKIAKSVPEHSPVYDMAVEGASILLYWGKRAKEA